MINGHVIDDFDNPFEKESQDLLDLITKDMATLTDMEALCREVKIDRLQCGTL